MNPKLTLAAEATVKYDRGDPLSDAEVKAALESWELLESHLRSFPDFKLAWHRALHYRNAFHDIQYARKTMTR